MSFNESLTTELLKELLKNHTHRFIELNDGTARKVCIVCGKEIDQQRTKEVTNAPK